MLVKFYKIETIFSTPTPPPTTTSKPETNIKKITQEELTDDLYITNVQKGVIDKNGKTKNVLQALALSKDRECYKEIEQLKGKNKEQSSMVKQNIESEPMKAYERKIIHSKLQGNTRVETTSVGEEPHRRIIVSLKK